MTEKSSYLSRVLVIALCCALALLAPIVDAGAAKKRKDRKAPRIVRAVMKDADRNGRADRLVLKYNERIRHRKDADGKYPFSVKGYSITKIKRARGRKLVILLAEKDTSDSEGRPNVSYKRVRKKPVRDRAGNQARRQTFKRTLGWGFPLDVTKSGGGTGTITSSPAGIDCGSSCSSGFRRGSTVTLSAAPESGSVFTGWGGDCQSAGLSPDCSIKMDQARSVTASFEPDDGNFTLFVTKAGTGTGTVSSLPAGIDCGQTCSARFAPATPIALTASADSDSSFVGWGGDCAAFGTAPACTVVMTADRTVSATFDLAGGGGGGTSAVSVSKTGTGTGTVLSVPLGINCGTQCTADFASGSTVTLTAVPDVGSTFGGWDGDCGPFGTAPVCTLSMSADRTVSAAFDAAGGGSGTGTDSTLTVSTLGAGSGTVLSVPGGVNCGSDCAEDFSSGTLVTLTAVPSLGDTFGGWGGDCSVFGLAPVCTLTMSADRSASATFDSIL